MVDVDKITTEIYHFEVPRAEAELFNVDSPEEGMVVRLFYPRVQRDVKGRFPESPESLAFGIDSLEQLLTKGFAQIGTQEFPLKPAAAGSLYLLNDNSIIVHRRDKFAPTHKMYHSAYAGYTHDRDFVFTEKGLRETGLRETAEECLVFLRSTIPGRTHLVIPNDSKDQTIASARRIGIKLGRNVRPYYINVDVCEPPDILEVYWEDNEEEPIFTARAVLDYIRESQTSLNALQIRKLPFPSNVVFPVDAEGMVSNDGKWKWFNRESYIIPLDDIAGKEFGHILEHPRVYQTRIVNGIPEVYTPEYIKPYLAPGIKLVSPDKPGIRAPVEVIHPHIWAPENLLTACLDALGVKGYIGKKHNIEQWKQRCMLEGTPLLPDNVLVK